ncbi:hypothetical protein [Kitasatospora sp. NPDC096204]|uniref:hypothetical protein n=1 Tax=Kitasatospora sp. NPDC096204 TaxID=3364094 RepID=UPI00382B0E59
MTAEPVTGRTRLRPGVAVTPLLEGLHLRGRGTSLTLEGSRSLPALWEVLSARLGAGPQDVAEAGDPRVEAALATVTAHLRAHGLLVEHPDGEQPPPWPGSVAERPGDAAAALAAACPVVASADPDGEPARAVARALARGGAAPVVTEAALPAGQVLVVAGDPPVAVGMQCEADGGFVTAPADPERTRADLAAIADRLRSGPGPSGDGNNGPGPSGDGPGSGGSAPRTLPLLLAAATAQRLLCAVAGLPNPGDPDDDPRLLAGRPSVLVARARPPRAEHHPWAAAPGPAAEPPADLETALRRVAALGDPLLGVLDAPSPGELPQSPVALAACRTPSGTLVAGAARTDLARLAGALRSAELHLAAADPGVAATVGADPGHALGRALRRAALAVPGGGAALPAAVWREHPQAAHWVAALARRLGRDAGVTVRRLAGHAFLATVEGARSVEAGPADAVSVAALGALSRLTVRDLGLSTAHHTTASGAVAPLAAAGQRLPAWVEEGWTIRWLAGLADREPDLRAELARLTGLLTAPWRPGTCAARPLANALEGCGFTVLVPAGDGR